MFDFAMEYIQKACEIYLYFINRGNLLDQILNVWGNMKNRSQCKYRKVTI